MKKHDDESEPPVEITDPVEVAPHVRETARVIDGYAGRFFAATFAGLAFPSGRITFGRQPGMSMLPRDWLLKGKQREPKEETEADRKALAEAEAKRARKAAKRAAFTSKEKP